MVYEALTVSTHLAVVAPIVIARVKYLKIVALLRKCTLCRVSYDNRCGRLHCGMEEQAS